MIVSGVEHVETRRPLCRVRLGKTTETEKAAHRYTRMARNLQRTRERTVDDREITGGQPRDQFAEVSVDAAGSLQAEYESVVENSHTSSGQPSTDPVPTLAADGAVRGSHRPQGIARWIPLIITRATAPRCEELLPENLRATSRLGNRP